MQVTVRAVDDQSFRIISAAGIGLNRFTVSAFATLYKTSISLLFFHVSSISWTFDADARAVAAAMHAARASARRAVRRRTAGENQ